MNLELIIGGIQLKHYDITIDFSCFDQFSHV